MGNPKPARFDGLIACPFCGSSEDVTVEEVDNDPEAWMISHHCGEGVDCFLCVTGPECMARLNWNHRRKVWDTDEVADLIKRGML